MITEFILPTQRSIKLVEVASIDFLNNNMSVITLQQLQDFISLMDGDLIYKLEKVLYNIVHENNLLLVCPNCFVNDKGQLVQEEK